MTALKTAIETLREIGEMVAADEADAELKRLQAIEAALRLVRKSYPNMVTEIVDVVDAALERKP